MTKHPPESLSVDTTFPAVGRPRAATTTGVGVRLVQLVVLTCAVLALTGLLRSVLLLAVLAVLALSLPVSADLSRRVVIVGALAAGLVPLLWWVRLPAALPSHAALLTAVLAVVVAGGLATGRFTLRALVPALRRTDAAGLAGMLTAVWMMLPNLRPTSGSEVLSRLMLGWDHAASFTMTELVRTQGVVTARAVDGPLGTWPYQSYPQGFHTMVATVTEALVGSGQVPPDQAVVLYGRVAALVCLAAVAVVLAGVCSLPALRHRPLLATAAVAFCVGAFVVGRGGELYFEGFPNFLLACAMVAVVVLLVAQMTTVTVPMAAGLAGATVAVAQNWALLLVLVAPALLAVVLPLRRWRWRLVARPAGRVGLGAVVVFGLAGVGTAAYQLSGQASLSSMLVMGGGISEVSYHQLWSVGAVGLVGAGLLVGWTRRRWPATVWLRAAGLAAVVLVGWAVVGVITWVQRNESSGDYYLVKFEVALLLVSVVVLVVVATTLVRMWRRPRLRVGLPVAVVTSVAGVLAFGWPLSLKVPDVLEELGVPASRGASARYWSTAPPPQGADVILQAALAYQRDIGPTGVGGPVVLLPFPSQANDRAMVALWFYATTGTWTDETTALLATGPVPAQDQATAVSTAMTMLRKDDDVLVMVGPDYYQAVRDAAAARGWEDRVLTW